MLSKVAAQTLKKPQQMSLVLQQARAFSHGPYNPLAYQHHRIPKDLPT